MIILTKGTRAIDIVKSVDGSKVVRLNDKELIYGQMAQFTQTVVETIPEGLDLTNLNSYNYENGTFTKIKKTTYTKKEFLDLLTQEQVINLWGSVDANVKYFVASMSMLDDIKTDNLQTQQALGYLLAEGYITQNQYDSII